MSRPPSNPGSWPRLMRAETAAAYCDEQSVEAFQKRVGSVYPRPLNVSGRGRVWLKEHLDTAIAGMTSRAADGQDAVNLL